MKASEKAKTPMKKTMRKYFMSSKPLTMSLIRKLKESSVPRNKKKRSQIQIPAHD